MNASILGGDAGVQAAMGVGDLCFLHTMRGGQVALEGLLAEDFVQAYKSDHVFIHLGPVSARCPLL